MLDVHIFFDELRKNGAATWIENNVIKLHLPKSMSSEGPATFIASHRAQIFSLLKTNEVFSKEKFTQTIIFKDGLSDYYPLSPAQERLWFIEQYEQGTNAYHIPLIFELAEGTQIEGVIFALQKIVARHEILRTTIESRLHEAVQVVHNRPLLVEKFDVANEPELQSLIRKAINEPFDLQHEFPIRVKFYQFVDNHPATILLINLHHIACDGWSSVIFQKELTAYYEAYAQEISSFDLPPLQIQYKDYALWQRATLRGETLQAQLMYWKKKLEGFPTLSFPTDFARPSRINYSGAYNQFSLSKGTSQKLRTLAKKYGATMHSVMLSSINILLSKYTGQKDIVTGSVTANRHYRQTEDLIGFFVNTQVNRTILQSEQSFSALIQEVHLQQVEAQANQDLPFEKLVDEMAIERDVTRHPIFQVLFVVQSLGNQSKAALEKTYFRPFKGVTPYEVEKFDLSIFVDDSQDEIRGQVVYAKGLFLPETIERFVSHYIHLLAQLTSYPEKAFDSIPLMQDDEFEKVVRDWNRTAVEIPHDKTIHQMFEEQASKTPTKVALVHEGKSLTYAELSLRSSALARHIQKECASVLSGKSNLIIGIYLDRGIEMVIAMLGVLKAGAAYMPIDRTSPTDRIAHILADSQTPVVLTTRQQNNSHLPDCNLTYIDLSEDFYHEDGDLRGYVGSPRDLAYLIYTSGTTGLPKGVMVEHHSAINTFISLFEIYKPDYRITAYTSYVFDVSVSEIFTTLLRGAELHIVSDKIRLNCVALSDYLIENKINVAYLPPVILRQLPERVYPNLKTLIYAGEPCDKQTARKWSHKVELFNYYGPTECSIYATGKRILTDEVEQIGTPILNTQAYVLDGNMMPVPVGVVGELYIGGAGVARGYLNNEALTSERFVKNPFVGLSVGKSEGSRLYKTGDLVRWLSDGNLEYMGRNDDQVKIRGYRIELAEIEHAMSSIPGIKQCCVVARQKETESGKLKYLVGYYVSSDHSLSNDSEIVQGWERLYDSEYDQWDGKLEDKGKDFSGWNSYISGLAIPIWEMESWRSDLLGKIRSLSPGRVLEVGVGSGLLMYPLLADVKQYVAIDISKAVIDRHWGYLRDSGYDVQLYHLGANELEALGEGEYDTVIINSVCQYFPSINYFEEVLEKVMGKVCADGKIFLGDIRNYDLHKDLIKEMLACRGEVVSTQAIQAVSIKENELLLSPRYFHHLAKRYNNIEVEVLLDRSGYANELSRYRYDVIIKVKSVGVDKSYSGKESVIGCYNTPYLNKISKESIVKALSSRLPDYMVPAHLVELESFPLTVNGKLDKRSLPDPEFTSEADYVGPETETEKRICGIWEEVLGLNRVGINDDFFKIGGNSILAIQVSHRMSKSLGCEVKVSDLFNHSKISDLVAKGLGQSQIIIPKRQQKRSLLSFSQERLWFIEQYEQGTSAYHIPMVFELASSTDIEGIKYSITEIVRRHEILRSTIEQGISQAAAQHVHEEPLQIEEVELSYEEDYRQIITSDINRPFDLQGEYPIRVKVYKLRAQDSSASGDRSILMITLHHIAGDGWSLEIFQREMISCYEGYKAHGKTFRLPELEIQYNDFAEWQRSYLQGEILERQLAYWKQKLSGYQSLALPTDNTRPGKIDYHGGNERFVISKTVSERVRQLARQQGVTLNTVLLSSVTILLSKYSGQQDIVIGSTIANRHHRQTEGNIGFFINMQVNRTVLSNQESFNELIQRVHHDQIAAQLHQDLPFEKLVSELAIERDTSRHPIFQVTFAVNQGFGQNNPTVLSDKKYLRPLKFSYEASEKFDLSIVINETGEELSGQISYAKRLFNPGTIERIVGHFLNLLSHLIQNAEHLYANHSLLSPDEFDQIVYRWNDTTRSYPVGKTINELIEEQVKRTPDARAVVHKRQELTYRQLSHQTDAFAMHLRTAYYNATGKQFESGARIGLLLERGIDIIIAMLGVSKAGGAYVPIDPQYPQHRIEYILTDCRPAIVVAHKAVLAKVRIPLAAEVVLQMATENLTTDGTLDSLPVVSGTDLQYVIYTSGSTGKPKGVMVEHQAFSQFICNFNDYIDDHFKPLRKNVLSVTNYTFDIFQLEYALPLISGSCINLSSIEELTKEEIANSDIIQQTPSTLNYVITSGLDGLNHLTCLVGGEMLIPTFAKKLTTTFKNVVNVYGPTETVVWSTAFRLNRGDYPYIGRPLYNENVYVLDENTQPVPVGVVGEIYIGGMGVARGYLNRDDLTQERFVRNPFIKPSEVGKDRSLVLYRTGDLAKWVGDGNLHFLGRNDSQVKIRGHRIELAEIETVITSISGVREACVLVRENDGSAGAHYLVAYYTTQLTAPVPTEVEIMQRLTNELPDFMIPSFLISLEEFPRTPNGKLDKGSFPNPEYSMSDEYVPPVSSMEIAVSRIWESALRVEKVGMTDDFFRIGGNSILAIEVSHQMTNILGRQVDIASIFREKNIKNILLSNIKEHINDDSNVLWKF
jgi:amino acid adenylation domain-containing protein